MSELAKVSVVIPCFNASRHIAATLDSVLAQSGVELEVIVVDDGSTDGSAELVASRYPKVRVIRQANAGVAAARNAGIAAASHEWVAFVDADDLWLPDKLKLQLQGLEADPQARVSYTAWQTWASDEPVPSAQWLAELHRQVGGARWQGASGWIYPELLLECRVWTSTVLARRELLRELGGFDPGLKVGEDWDLWLRASRLTPILKVPRPLAIYRQHPASLTRRVHETNYQYVVVSRALSRWGYRGPDGRRARRWHVARGLAKSWLDMAGAHLGSGERLRARGEVLRSLRCHPASGQAWWLLLKTIR